MGQESQGMLISAVRNQGLANQILGIVPLGNTGENLAVCARAVIQGEFMVDDKIPAGAKLC